MFQTQHEYTLFYYLLIGCVVLFRAFLKRRFTNRSELIVAFILSAVIGLIIGGRPISVGTDTSSYYSWFYDANHNLLSDSESMTFGGDPIITLYFKIMGVFFSVKVAVGLISFIFTFLCYIFSRQFCEKCKIGDGFTLFTFILLSHIAFNFEINIIRAAVGTVFWLFFTINLYQKAITRSILWGFLALFTHFSTIIFIILAIIALTLKVDLKKYLILYFVSIIVSLVGISILSVFNVIELDMLNLDKAVHYISNIDQSSYKTGFRLDFTIFNTFFLVLSIFLSKNKPSIVMFYIKLYILCSVLFFLWFAIPFSDRIGAFGWIIIPVFIYPLLILNLKRESSIIYIFILCFGTVSFILS